MKNRIIALSLALTMLLFAGQASANIVQLWECRTNDGSTADDVMRVSKEWTDAARSMDGGADMEVFVEWAEATSGKQGSFNFVMVLADFATWGTFTDNYDGSAAAEADAAFFEAASCDTSTLWDSIEIE